jgi:hypothetical protein
MHPRFLALGLILAMDSSPSLAQGPVQRGVWLIGGNVRLRASHDISRGFKDYAIGINPQVGVFVIKGLAVTLNTTVDWSKPAGGVPTTSIGLGPSTTYYLSGIGRRFYPYGAIRTFYLFTRRKGNIGSETDPFSLMSISANGWA